MRTRFWGTVAAVVALGAGTVVAGSMEGDIKRIQEASEVLTEIHAVPDKDIPQDLWDKAECAAVIPSVKKAAFVVGGEYGKGLLSCRVGGRWSAPSFLVLEKGSWGFQIGGESVDLVLLVMNPGGLNKLLNNKVALGAEMSVAAGPVGRDARAMTDVQLKAEMLSYSRAQGLFAGIDLTGGVVKPDTDENRVFYGKPVEPRALLLEGTVPAPAAATPFMHALMRGTVPGTSR